jgi:hypothetical protein
MRRSTTGRDGDHLVVCDRSGFTVWASETVREWNGLIVHKRFYEARHPQDYLRARRENLTIPDARPEPTAIFIGPLMTELTNDDGVAAGTTSISVTSTSRMTAGDSIGVYLSSGDLYRTTIASVDSSTALTLSAALPGAVSEGARIIDYSATAS